MVGTINVPLGLACGYSVYLTRSIWTGVLINMVFSGSIILVDHDPAADGAFPGFGEGENGIAHMAVLMTLSAVVAVAVWRHQRVIRDRTADDAPETPEHAADHTD